MKLIRGMVRHFFKVHRKMGQILSAVLLVFMAVLLVSFVGFPKDIEETCEAAVITESGEVLTCQLQVRGNGTYYPLRQDRNAVEMLSIWAGDNLVVEFEWVQGTVGFSSSYRYTGILDRENQRLLAEVDGKTISPELEGQRCVVAVPVMEQAAAAEMLAELELPESHQSAFSWVKD